MAAKDNNTSLDQQTFWFKIAAFLAFISFSMCMTFVIEIRASHKDLSADIGQIKESQASMKARVSNIERIVYKK